MIRVRCRLCRLRGVRVEERRRRSVALRNHAAPKSDGWRYSRHVKPADTPVALVYRATWPEQRSYQGTLASVLRDTKRKEWNLTTMLLVGAALGQDVQTESSLYSRDFTHIFRVVKKKKPKAAT